MTDIPETPIVPPAPSRLNLGSDFAEKADALAAFYATLVAYIAAAIAWIVDAMQQIAATALAGTLPSLSGHALKFMRVNASGTMAEFVAPTEMLGGTALVGMETGHTGGAGFVVIRGNFAIGATEPTNTAFWSASEVVNGVTFTQISSNVDPVTGNTRIVYDAVGTLSASTASFGYVSTASQTDGVSGENWTASAFVAVTGPAGGGGGAAQVGTGVRVFQFQTTAGTVFGGAVSGARALSTIPRLLAVSNTVRCSVQLVGSSGATINARIVVEGLQFEKAAARTNLRFVEATASTARTLLDLCAVGSAAPLSGPFVDRSGIPAHANEVTFTLTGVTRTGAQMPLLQAMVAGAAVTTGYLATSSVAYGSTLNTGNFTAGFGINNNNASADVLGGKITLTRFAAGSNLWIASGQIYSVQGAPQAISVQGQIDLSGPLSGLRFNGNGATLTAGSIALTWRV